MVDGPTTLLLRCQLAQPNEPEPIVSRIPVRVATILGVFFLDVSLLRPLPAQETSRPRSEEARVAQLRADAERLNRTDLSPLFAAISDSKVRADLGVTNAQLTLSKRIEQLTRVILQSWLLDRLDANPVPAPGELADRLSEQGVKIRESIIAHSDAIVLESVLARA